MGQRLSVTGHLNPSIRSEWATESPTHSTNIKRLLCARKSVSALETHSDHPPPQHSCSQGASRSNCRPWQFTPEDLWRRSGQVNYGEFYLASVFSNFLTLKRWLYKRFLLHANSFRSGATLLKELDHLACGITP